MSASNAWFHALLAPFARIAESAASATSARSKATPSLAAAVPAPHTTPSSGASIVNGRTSPRTAAGLTSTSPGSSLVRRLAVEAHAHEVERHALDADRAREVPLLLV